MALHCFWLWPQNLKITSCSCIYSFEWWETSRIWQYEPSDFFIIFLQWHNYIVFAVLFVGVIVFFSRILFLILPNPLQSFLPLLVFSSTSCAELLVFLFRCNCCVEQCWWWWFSYTWWLKNIWRCWSICGNSCIMKLTNERWSFTVKPSRQIVTLTLWHLFNIEIKTATVYLCVRKNACGKLSIV